MANMFDIEIRRRQALQRSRQLAAVTGNPTMARRQLETELTSLNRGFSGARIQAERIKFSNVLAQRNLGLQERRVELQEERFEEELKAAKGQRLGQSLTGLAQLGLAGKELGIGSLFSKGVASTAGQQLATTAGIPLMAGGGATGQGLLAGTTPLTSAFAGGTGGAGATGAGIGIGSLAGTVAGTAGIGAVGFGLGSVARGLIAPEGHRGGERFTAAGAGALGGAASGAAIGSIVPGIGTVIGGIIGGIMGAVGGGK